MAFSWKSSEEGFIGKGRYGIYIKMLGGSEPLRLTHGEADEFAPAWSPDGRFIAFLRDLSPHKSGVFLIPAIGGPERKLAEFDGGSFAWFPDSKWLAIVDRPSPSEPFAVFLLSLETGEKRRLTSPSQNSLGDGSPSVSPDGRALVFTRVLEENVGDLFLLELSEGLRPKGEPRQLTFEKRYTDHPTWTPDGRAIVFSSGSYHTPSLWEIVLSPRGLRPGKPERLAFAGEGARNPAISRQGHLAYGQLIFSVHIWRLELNGGRPTAKTPVKLITSTRIDHDARYSPDGKRIAFASNRSGSWEIWVSNSDGSNVVQLTSFGGAYVTAGPRWSPNGQEIYFGSNVEGKLSAYVIKAEGGQAKRLTEGVDERSRDGKWIYFGSKRSGEYQLWKRPVDGGNAVQVTRKGYSGTDIGGDAVESTDGKFVYYLKGGGAWKVPVQGGEETQVLELVVNNNFAVVDQGIYFIPSSERPSVQFLNFATGKVVVIARIGERGPDYGLTVSPDGRWLLYAQYESVRSDLKLVQNFR